MKTREQISVEYSDLKIMMKYFWGRRNS